MKQIRHRTGAVTEMEQTTAKKNKYEIDMCNGTIMDKLISFSLPLMLSGILQLMFNAVDIIVVGRFSGSQALAAVGSTSALINVFTNLFIGISLGANVLAARFFASGREKEMSDTVHTAILLALISGILMAGIGVKEGLAEKALESVKNRLDTKYGIVLLQPAYTYYHLELGEISSYPEGYKENAGIFCHNNPWISIAETVVGRGNRAWQVYTRTCPAYIEDISEIHRTEPYVYSQMIAGKDAPNFGEAKNSWLTGTAAWTFLDVSQYILGIRPDYDGLVIDPCIPSSLDGFTARRDFRGTTYHVTVKNPNHVEKGVISMTVDGKDVDVSGISGGMIPIALAAGKKDVNVEVVMG